MVFKVNIDSCFLPGELSTERKLQLSTSYGLLNSPVLEGLQRCNTMNEATVLPTIHV